jgi:hypothetical protein
LTSKGSSAGIARITGLPFSIGTATNQFFSAASLWINNISFLNQFQARGGVGTTNIELWEVTTIGGLSNLTDLEFANNSEFLISFTYFV